MESPGTRAPLLYIVGRAVLLCAVALGAALPVTAPVQGARGAAADTLHVLRVSPIDATTDAPRATPIVVFFDRPMVPLTALETPPTMAPARLDPPLPGQGRWLNTATWAWSPPLHGATRYTVTVPAGLRALDGATLPAPYTASFSTVRPAVARVTPGDGATYADYRASITVRFNQDVDRASVAAAFVLRDGAGRTLSGGYAWPRADTLVFRPVAGLAPGVTYRAAVGAGLRSAEGALAASGRTSWSFTTAGNPVVDSTTPANGDRSADVSNGLTLHFTAPVDPKLVGARLLILPRPDNLNVYSDDNGLTVHVYGDFAPSTHYHLGLDGVIGTYGQALARPLRLGFTTAPLAPSVQFAYSGSIVSFDAYRPVDIAVRGVNARAVTLTLYPLSQGEFLGLQQNGLSQDFAPAARAIYTARRGLSGPLNGADTIGQELPSVNGTALMRPGYYFLRAKGAAGGSDQMAFMVTRTSLTLKTSNDRALVWAVDLHTGRPLPGLAVRLVRATNGGGLVLAGHTGADGVLDARETYPASPNDGALVALLDRPGDAALCTTNWNSNVSAYDYHLPAIYGPPSTRQGYLYTDRPIYRPNGPVRFRGLIRSDDDGAYGLLAAGTSVRVTLSDSNNHIVYNTTARLDTYGAFAGTLTLPANTALGVDTLAAQVGGQSFNVTLQVAAYRKPDYTVAVTPTHADANYTTGAPVTVTVAARYLFDAPLNKAKVHWSVVKNDLYFSAPAYPDYTFQDYPDTFWYSGAVPQLAARLPGYPAPADSNNGGNSAYYPSCLGSGVGATSCGQGGGTGTVVQGDAHTDANGNLTLAIPADLRRSPLSQQWSVEAEVTDINNASVSGRAAVSVHKGRFYIGLHQAAPFVVAGQPARLDLLTLGQDGATTVPRVPLTLTLYRRTYHEVNDPNSPFPQERPVDTFVRTFAASTGVDGHGAVPVTLPSSGEYRLVATARDASGRTAAGNPIRSALSLYAVGADEAFSPWANTPEDRARLVPDKGLYRVGDVARVLVAAPRPDMTALVTIERGRVYSHQVVRLAGASPTLRVPILPCYLPNVFVSVVLVAGTDARGDAPLWKMGVAELPVDVRARRLRLSLRADTTRARPGATIMATLHAATPDGRPVQGEFSLAVADAGVLSLAAEAAPSILDGFYAERGLGVQTAYSQNIRGFQVSAADLAKGNAASREKHAAFMAAPARTGGGGGGGSGAGPTGKPRAYFPDTAYWNASVTTGADGAATLPITLPDNLTTWRLSARGLTRDTLVGQTTLDVVSTRDLLLRPLLPRFFTLGDQADAGAVVNNTTNRTLTARVTLTASGAVAPSGLEPRTVTVAPSGERLVTWPLRPGVLGTARLLLTVTAPGVDGDSVIVAAPVTPNSTPETVATSGEVGTSRLEMVRVPAGAQPGEGGLTLTLQPSLAAGLRSSVDFLQQYPYESNEDLAARVMGEVSLLRLPATATGLDAATLAAYHRDVAATAAVLAANQRDDGGWGWWSGSLQSEPSIAAFCLDALGLARHDGYPVPAGALASGTGYIGTQARGYDAAPLAVPNDASAVPPDLRAYLGYLLAVHGSGTAGTDLYPAHDTLPLWSRGYLLRALYLQNGLQLGPRGHTVLAELESGAHLDAAGAHWEESGDPLSGDDAIHATAVVLDALIEVDPTSPLIPQATRWLVGARSGEAWQTTVDNAVALRALSDELRGSGELNGHYTYAATLDGRPLGQGSITAATLATPRVLQAPLGATLAPGATTRVEVRRSNTSGRLYDTTRLTYYPRVETVGALNRGLAVARVYLYNGRPVTSAPVGATLRVRLTVTAPQDLYYLALEDPLPAGGEAVDPTLLTTSQPRQGGYSVPQGTNDLAWYITHAELRDDRAALFVDYLPKGVYRYEYDVHLTTRGVFHALPAHAAESLFPEVFGRGAGGYFTVR